MPIPQDHSRIMMKDSLEYCGNCTVINKVNPINLINPIN